MFRMILIIMWQAAIARRQKAVCLIKRTKSEFTNITFSASSRVNPSV